MAASIAWSPVTSNPLDSLTGRYMKRKVLTPMGYWMEQSPGTSEQQLQKKKAAEDRGGEGSFGAHASLWGNRGGGSFDAWSGNRGEGSVGDLWGNRGEGTVGDWWDSGGRVGILSGLRTFNRLENKLSNCCVPSGQELTSRVADIRTALQLHSARAIYHLRNDEDTLFSFVTLLGFLLAECLVVTIARHALHVSYVLCSGFRVGGIAGLSLAALACKMVSLVIK